MSETQTDSPIQLALVFPGQGSQSLGMLQDLAAEYPVIEQTFAEASEGAGVDLWTLSKDGPVEQLNQTEFTQPALLAASVALYRVWQEQGGATPKALSGHSLGEYSALVAAGALTLKDAAKLVRTRGQLMQDAAPAGTGGMAAVLGAEDDVVAQACTDASTDSEKVVPANFNSPGQIVIGGHQAAVDRAVKLLGERGVRKVMPLAVSVPSHTPLMRDAAEKLREELKNVAWQAPNIPVIQNVDAQVHHTVEEIQDALVRQLFMPVLWTQCVQALKADGITTIVECGPGKVLSGLIKRIDKELDAKPLGTSADMTNALTELKA